MWLIICLNYRQPLAAKCLLCAEVGDVAVALAAVDVMDVMDVLDVDLTAAADMEVVAMTLVDVGTASQAQPLSTLGPALTKTPLTA